VKTQRLPAQGIAVGSEKKVVLIDLSGEVIEKLPRFTLAGSPGARDVWLARGRDYYRLAQRRGLVVPVAGSRARSQRHQVNDVPKLSAPSESRVKGIGVVGRWWYGFEFGGEATLAQWLGECEIATAYWSTPGGRLEIITGGNDLSRAPQSLALGWSTRGEAVVLLQESGCGVSGDTPGIYLFSSPGEGKLLFPIERNASAVMWSKT
jgi:hypothetical protein